MMKNKIKNKHKLHTAMYKCGGPGTPGSGMKRGEVPDFIIYLIMAVLVIIIAYTIFWVKIRGSFTLG